MRGLFLLLSLSIVLISSAYTSHLNAADLFNPRGSIKDAPITYRPYTWQGVYFGLHAGYAVGDTTTENLPGSGNGNGFDDGNAATKLELDPEGFAGGIQVGYNKQTGRVVLGIEGEAGYFDLDDRKFGENFADVEYGFYGILTGKLGYAFNKYLFYFKGGVAIADIESQAADVSGGVAVASDSTKSDEVHLGYAVGGGVEYALSSIWSVKAEYLFLDFDDETSTNADGDVFKHEHDLHTIKIGVNHRF